jgi:hypothetical protein
MPSEEFDVFLCHNSKDKDFILEIYDRLSARGIKPWIDDHLVPGRRSSADLAQQIRQVRSVAVFVGKHGVGPWQQQEIDLAIAENTRREMPVIPVLLEDAPDDLELPHFVVNLTWVDFRKDRHPFERLVKGIPSETKTVPVLASNTTGLKPGVPDPRVRLPDNFVDRPDAINAVKSLLLTEEKTVVVSAIAGLGGLGKSVLATALVLDDEVRSRFCDGILWVTLGQNPDLLGLLGDWIRALDKSRESYAATTLEAASRYLQTLLLEKRVLLVVDDAWNAAHVEYFRVGGAGCRVLVTTREAQIDGAEYFALDWMTETEAIALVSKKLGQRWRSEMEPEMRAFSKSLGYLPLALDLAANLVRDGLSWGELRSEFEAERRAVALEVLDLMEAFGQLSVEEQRKYSLKACFNLSLQRLTPEQLRQFAWLGVLPEDVTIDSRMATTLWNLPKLRAKRLLIEFWRRSLLTNVGMNAEEESSYRVHDLMHDTARGLIEQGTLAESIQDLSSAHIQFLERYRSQGDWHRLSNDGYIYRHLSWHFVQAGWEDALHDLLALSDEHGRNAWFEACDRIGEPGVFVQDVKRGWALAEGLYERDGERAIVLQCRYALVMGTLNSLVESLTGKLIMTLVKEGLWTAEQAWTYVEQMQDEESIARSIMALLPLLPKGITELAVKKGRSLQNKFAQALILSAFTQINESSFADALEAAQLIDEEDRAWILIALTKIDGADFNQLLKAALSIQHEDSQSLVLSALVKVNGADFTKLFMATQSMQDEFNRARVLTPLAQVKDSCFRLLLIEARSMQDNFSRASILSVLAKTDKDLFDEALEAAQSIQDERWRAEVLTSLAFVDKYCLAEALRVTQLIKEDFLQASVLTKLTQVDDIYLSETLRVIRSIRDPLFRGMRLDELTEINGINPHVLLEASRSIQDENNQASVLSVLGKIGKTYIDESLKVLQLVREKTDRASVLSVLAQIDKNYFSEALTAVNLVEDPHWRTSILTTLSQIDKICFTDALKAARSIQDVGNRALALSRLAQIDKSCFDEALANARSTRTRGSNGGLALNRLARIDKSYFDEALANSQTLKSPFNAMLLSDLAQINASCFVEALTAARAVRSTSQQAQVLISLVRVDKFYFSEALTTIQEIESEYWKALSLAKLAQYAPEHISLEIDQTIETITHLPTRAEALSGTLPYRPLATLPHPDWCATLHLLANRTRADLMGDLATLHPAILHLGGEAAVRSMVDAMREVCQQWK